MGGGQQEAAAGRWAPAPAPQPRGVAPPLPPAAASGQPSTPSALQRSSRTRVGRHGRVAEACAHACHAAGQNTAEAVGVEGGAEDLAKGVRHRV